MLLGSVKALITRDKQVNERLIRDASLSRVPVEPLLDCRSLPARSIKCNRPTRTAPAPKFACSLNCLDCLSLRADDDFDDDLDCFPVELSVWLFSTVSIVRDRME